MLHDKFFYKHKVWILLGLIWLFALFLRIYHLGSLPFNFMEDEVLVGYVGRFILQNGVDLYGNHWPIWYFDKFGDYYIIGPMYLAGLSTFIFGVNEFAVRFPAALFGSLVVFPVFSLSVLIFNKRTIALTAAFLTAVTPWHLVISRSSSEGVIGSTIFLSGICLLLYFAKKLKLKYLIISTILFGVSYFIYHPFRAYVPLVFIPIPFLFPAFFGIVGVFIAFVLLTGYIITTPWGSGRLKQTSIFSPLSGVERKIQEEIYAIGEGKVLQARIFHNKLIGYSREFTKQYISYFSPDFLFTGFGAESRYEVPEQGLLYYTYLILLIIAVIPIKNQNNIHKKYILYFLFLLLISPVPAAFSYFGSPNIHRSSLLGILIVIPITYGFTKLQLLPYKKIISAFIIAMFIVELFYFWCKVICIIQFGEMMHIESLLTT